MKSFSKILRFAKGHKSYAFLNIVFNILSVIFELLSVLLFMPFLNLMFNEESEPVINAPKFSYTKEFVIDYYSYNLGQIVDHGDKVGALLFVCVLVGILFFLKNFFRYFAMYFISVLRTGVVRDLRKSIHDKILTLPLSYYSEQRKGDIMSRMSADVQEVEWSILNSIEMLFREPIAVLISIIVLVFMNPELTLFSLILLPISGFAIGQLGKSLKRSSTKVQDKIGDILSYIEETLGGIRIIKAFNAEKNVREKFEHINNGHTRLSLRMSRKRDAASPLSEFLGSAVMVCLAYYGGSLVLDGDRDFSGAEFLGYIIVFARLLSPVKAFFTAYAIVLKGAASADRIDAILNAKNHIVDPKEPKKIDILQTSIEYKNVEFSYEDSPVLKDINVVIPKGKTIALVGESGGGKSTFTDLLPRFYDLKKGEILIDGINIVDLTLKDLRKLMGIVTQESILFNDTIYNNIAFGTSTTTKDEVVEAAKIANAHEFIMEMENGYETNIGDRGGKLSGGQRQRISIARAILKNPPILILDEATSALDTESEKLVQDALFKLMKNRTSIVIAHRLSTIQHADEILVIQSGQIVERGTHLELLKLNGVYKKLSDLQTFSD